MPVPVPPIAITVGRTCAIRNQNIIYRSGESLSADSELWLLHNSCGVTINTAAAAAVAAAAAITTTATTIAIELGGGGGGGGGGVVVVVVGGGGGGGGAGVVKHVKGNKELITGTNGTWPWPWPWPWGRF